LRIFFKESALFKPWLVEDGQVAGQVTQYRRRAKVKLPALENYERQAE